MVQECSPRARVGATGRIERVKLPSGVGRAQILDTAPLGAFRRVCDLDEYRDVVVGAESETVQLGPGRLQATLYRMPLGDMTLNAVAHNSLPISTTAVGPADAMTFVILLNRPAWGDFNGHPHSIGGCQVLGPAGPLVTHNPPGMEVAIFQTPRCAVSDRAHELGRDTHVPDRYESICIPGTTSAARSLKEYVGGVLDVSMDPALRPDGFDAEAFKRVVKEEITTLSALALDRQPQEDTSTFRRRKAIVDQARAYTEANAGRAVSLAELCRATLSSERALQYAFREITGLSPTTYLRLRALHRVRSELRESTPGDTTVSEVAMRWGFWHLGRFAAAYRRTFGATPSQTLRGQTSGSALDATRPVVTGLLP
jgi:AraC-like DNA-binding protein